MQAGTQELSVETNGVRLPIVLAGGHAGIPAILLHGFPDFWCGWRHQVSPRVEAGYRQIMPDQGGYSLSENQRKPVPTESKNEANMWSVWSTILAMAGCILLGMTRVRLWHGTWGSIIRADQKTCHPECPASFSNAGNPAQVPVTVVEILVHRFLPGSPPG